MATRPTHRAGSTRNDAASARRGLRDLTGTPGPARRAPCPGPAPVRVSPRPRDTRSLEMVNFSGLGAAGRAAGGSGLEVSGGPARAVHVERRGGTPPTHRREAGCAVDRQVATGRPKV